MTNLEAQANWSDVRQLESNELARGGLNGNMNEQAKALLNRTEYLNQQKANKADIIQGQYSFATLAAFNSVKATIPANSTVIIDEAGTNQGANTWNGSVLTKSLYDPLTQANNNLTNVRKISISYTKRLNLYINNTGAEAAFGNAFVSNPISISGFSYLQVENLKAINSQTYAVAFYDASGVFISSGSVLLSANASLASTGVITIPVNATTFKISGDNTASTQPTIYRVATLAELESEILTNKQTVDSSIATINDTFYQRNKVEIPFSKISGNYRIKTDGTLEAWGGMITSDKLQASILAENTITIENLSTPNDSTLILAFYDASDVFISGVTASNNTVIAKTENIVVPSNASYFRICYNRLLSTAKIYKTVTSQLTFNEISSKETSINVTIKKSSKVKLAVSLVVGNYAINTDGTLQTWGNMRTSELIPISGFSIIAIENISAKSDGGVAVAFYDDSGVFISSGLTLTANQVVADTGLISVPTNAASFRYCYNTTLSTAIGYAVSAQYAYDLLKSEMLAITKPYNGKKILSLGDSYTWLNHYGSALTKTTGCTQRARGQNGNVLKSFCNDSYTGSDGNPVSEVFDATLLAQYDIVTIMGGTNDYGHGSATLGTISDTKDQNTIYGSVKFLIDKIQTLKPTIKIVFITQPFRLQYSTETAPGGYLPNSNGLTMQNIAQAIKECAGLYGCPVYDFYSLSNWNELTIKKNSAGNWNDNIYTYDGLHPRQGAGKGGELLGQGLGRFINRL